MAKVEINESIIQLQHEGETSTQTKNEGENEKEGSEESEGFPFDVDTLIDLCVERVFEMLQAKYDR